MHNQQHSPDKRQSPPGTPPSRNPSKDPRGKRVREQKHHPAAASHVGPSSRISGCHCASSKSCYNLPLSTPLVHEQTIRNTIRSPSPSVVAILDPPRLSSPLPLTHLPLYRRRVCCRCFCCVRCPQRVLRDGRRRLPRNSPRAPLE